MPRSQESTTAARTERRDALDAAVTYFTGHMRRPLAAVCMAFLMGGTAWGQNLAGSSTATSASQSQAVGAEVSSQVEAFAEGVPELQRTDRASLRDTGSRGGFVGADTGDVTIFGEGTRTTSAGSRRTTGRATGRGGSRQTGRQPRSSQTGGPTIRPTLALGFRYVPRPAPNLGQKIADSLNRLPQIKRHSSILVRVQGSTVVLEGSVPTSHERALSEQIVALSPGVTGIENRLAVEGVHFDVQPEQGGKK